MKGHNNQRAASRGGKQWFYNFCVRLLMERATAHCERDAKKFGYKNPLLKVVFSKRGGHSYGQTKAYWEILKAQAAGRTTFLQKREIRHQLLKFNLVTYVPHTQAAGLQLADIVASAFYQSVNVRSKIWSTSPAMELKPRVPKENGVAADYGVVLQPTPPRAAELTHDQKRIFEFYGYEF